MPDVIAIKLPGTRLEWDAPRMRFKNCREADALIKPPYRRGWKL